MANPYTKEGKQKILEKLKKLESFSASEATDDLTAEKKQKENPLTKTKERLFAAISKESAVKAAPVERDSLHAVREHITEKEKPRQKVNPIMGAKKSIVRPLRTYKDDIIEAIRKKKASLVTIVAAEQKARAKKAPLAPEPPSHERRTQLTIILISAVLILAGTASLVFFYIRSSHDSAPTELGISALVFSEEEEAFDITELSGQALLNKLNSEKNKTTITLNTIKHLYITKDTLLGKRLASASSFLETIEVRAPTALLRSLESEFMLGIHSFDGNQPFLILKTRSFDSAFASMLDWEANMSRDLSPLFGPTINRSLVAIGEERVVPTIGRAVFTDIIIKSKDARALFNERGRAALLYSFLDKQTIVITTNENTFNEIVTRLSSTRISR